MIGQNNQETLLNDRTNTADMNKNLKKTIYSTQVNASEMDM